jgi:hypothetical protein
MISNYLRQVGAGLAEFLEREAGHVIVLMILIWWGWPTIRPEARPGIADSLRNRVSSQR